MRKILSLVGLFFLVSNFIFAQSDAQIVQDYKAKHKSIQNSIENATSTEECTEISQEISMLQSKYAEHKELLDGALYPDDFNSSIQKLKNALSVKKADVTHITVLTEEVSQLTILVNQLNEENKLLSSEIKTLRLQGEKDKRTIDSLNTLVKRYWANIQKRDELIFEMVDSIIIDYNAMPTAMDTETRLQLSNKTDRKNLFPNIKKSISEKRSYLTMIDLQPTDYGKLVDDQQKFEEMWSTSGPKFADIYLDKKDRASEIEEINRLVEQWRAEIYASVWDKIDKIFEKYKIRLGKFENGNEFEKLTLDFIEREIDKTEKGDLDELEQTYIAFSDSVWFGELESEWLSVLLQNDLLTNVQRDNIETKLAEWGEIFGATAKTDYTLFIIIGMGVIIIVLIVIILLGKKKKVQE
ncbi:MAG: hypothetical protein JW866_04350 [Ignavibacteriales bacterium]|nr:hypothetical protein [Ignavibacteriales bacterium]